MFFSKKKHAESQQNLRTLFMINDKLLLSYDKLLDLTNKTSWHQQCLNSLMTEVYKCLNGLSPDILNDGLADLKHWYNTCHYNLFVTDWPN